MKKYLEILLSAALFCACSQPEDKWVNFDGFSSLDPATSFVPYQTDVTELNEDVFMASRLPGGETLADVSADSRAKTSSFNAATLIREFLGCYHSAGIVSYSGSYPSVDEKGNPIRLSGRILLPADGKVTRLMVVSHFSIGSAQEAPSLSFPLEGIFAARGLAVIFPDYLGFGLTVDRIHPYLCKELTARNVVDMLLAAEPFLQKAGITPRYNDILLYGYSQGGAATMAVLNRLERLYPEIKIRRVIAGGGPYDICATYNKLVEYDHTDYPCAVPMIIQGLNTGENLGLDYADFFMPDVLQNFDKWVNSKQYNMSEITLMMGTKRLSDILTPVAMDRDNEKTEVLYRAMKNNLVVEDTRASVPVILFHSVVDRTVPFENALAMKERLESVNADATFYFDDYGNHQMSTVRCLFFALDLLKEKGDFK